MHADHGLGDLVDDEEVGRVAQVVIGFHHHQFGIHLGVGEVPVGCCVTDVRRHVAGQVDPVVVRGVVAGQCEQADEGQHDGQDQYRAGPADGGGADAAPAAGTSHALGLQHLAEASDDRDERGPKCQCCGDHDRHTDGQRNAHGLEVRQPGEVQAECCSCDRQTRRQHDVRGAVKHRVVGRFSVFARASRFLVAADQEDRVVGGGSDGQGHQHVRRKGGEPEDVVIAEKGDDAAGRKQPDDHHRERDQHRHDRSVDQQQHHGDDGEREPLDHLHARVADGILIGRRRRRPRHVRLDTGGRVSAADDVANGFHRLVGDRLALVTGDVHLHVSGLAVHALGAGSGQRIAPEVLDVLNVCGVGA